jgi:hypothetical protein
MMRGALAGLGCVLLLAGCGSKLSQKEAAAKLHAELRPASKVSCHSVSGYWDYTCRVAYPGETGMHIDLRVNANDITDQSGP